MRKTHRNSGTSWRQDKPADIQAQDALFLTPIPQDAAAILNTFQDIIHASHPLNSKQRALLPEHIRALSHLLTDERNERRLGYMNQTTTLSAYVHYYVWWNLLRLTRLFANLPDRFFSFADSAVCLDIGSGPLTLPIALYLARPELRTKKLRWYCLDISSQALSFGEDLLLSIAATLKSESWDIIKVRGNLNTHIKEKVQFITCANVFNEIIQNEQQAPDHLAKKYGEHLISYLDTEQNDARILVVEPGVPSCARFISLLRETLLRRQFFPCSPCPHSQSCPLDGKKGGKWCHYVLPANEAPDALKKLSENAHLAKERAVLSFIAAQQQTKSTATSTRLCFRIASDPIRLPKDRIGYYACSAQGLLLVISRKPLHSGERFSLSADFLSSEIDRKTGARIVELDTHKTYQVY